MTDETAACARSEGRAAARRLALPVLAIGLAATVVASLAVGPAAVSLGDLAEVAASAFVGDAAAMTRERVILMDIRLPRTILGCLVGAALAVAGAMMQGLFRNPLADPGLVGVSAGAALAAVATIVLGGVVGLEVAGHLAVYALPVSAFLGGLATTLVLYAIATRRGRTSVATMLLAGIAIAALTGALTGYLIFLSDDSELRDFTFWSMGSLGGATWAHVVALLPFVALVLAAIPLIAQALNALLLGEAEAFHLGHEPQRLKRRVVVATAAATGGAVAAAGVIGFVGIVVPHLLRVAFGPDHRLLLPGCALLGAMLVVAADTFARTVVAPAELPIGIVMAVIGAPVFLSILLRRRSIIDL